MQVPNDVLDENRIHAARIIDALGLKADATDYDRAQAVASGFASLMGAAWRDKPIDKIALAATLGMMTAMAHVGLGGKRETAEEFLDIVAKSSWRFTTIMTATSNG